MTEFIYKALDRNGKMVKGRLQAADGSAAHAKLDDMKLSPFELRPAPRDLFSFNFKRRAKLSDYSRYFRQFATLLDAGVPLLDALKSLSRSASHPALSTASQEIAKDLRSGMRLSATIEAHMPGLPNYVPRLAQLGEATGKTAKALLDSADRMDFELQMQSEVKTALSYPLFLASVGTLIVIFMFIFVVPRFGTLVEANNADLPLISAIVINSGMFFQENLFVVGVIFVALVFGLIAFIRNKDARSQFRAFMMRTPLVGQLLFRSEIGSWARTVGMALDNGADILTALNLGASGLKSYTLKRAMEDVRTEIRAGRNMDDVLETALPEIDPLTIDLIRTGRQSGKLAEILLFIGKTGEDETRERAKRLAAIAEPAAILLISLVVGLIVISIVLAMTSLYDFAI